MEEEWLLAERSHVRAVSGWDSPSRLFLHKRWKQNYNYSTPLENKGLRAEMSDCGASSNRGRWLTFTSKKIPRRKSKLRRRCRVGKFKATLHTCFILKCISHCFNYGILSRFLHCFSISRRLFQIQKTIEEFFEPKTAELSSVLCLLLCLRQGGARINI